MLINYELLSFIQGSRRKKVLKCLENEIKTPKQIAQECQISISNVSNTLPELISKKLVECKNPKSHVNKYFEITAKGKQILSQLKQI